MVSSGEAYRHRESDSHWQPEKRVICWRLAAGQVFITVCLHASCPTNGGLMSFKEISIDTPTIIHPAHTIRFCKLRRQRQLQQKRYYAPNDTYYVVFVVYVATLRLAISSLSLSLSIGFLCFVFEIDFVLVMMVLIKHSSPILWRPGFSYHGVYHEAYSSQRECQSSSSQYPVCLHNTSNLIIISYQNCPSVT